MTTYSEYGPVTPIRRPDNRYVMPGLSLDGTVPVKPPYPVKPPAKPPYPEPGIPPKPPYPEPTVPPKPPYPEPTIPPKPPYPETGTPIPPASPSPTVPPISTKPPVSGNPPGTTGVQPPATPGSLGLDFMRQVTPNELVANQLNNLLSSDSRYIQNARQRGLEFANSRGNLNSSIGAGASERAAIEAGLPIAESDAGVYRQANEGNFSALNQLRQMRTAAELDNWLSSENFTRDFNGRLAMLPIESGADMLAYITQRAMEDPAVWTPDVISGFNNFFNLNFQDMFGNFFSGPGGD